MRFGLASLAVVAMAGTWTACVGDAPAASGGPSTGDRLGACFPDDKCKEGLECRLPERICLTPGEPVPDAGSVSDGSADGTTNDGGDASTSFCPDATAYFCDDFERVELFVGTDWLQRKSGSAGLRIDAPKSFSPTLTLHGEVPSGAATENHLYYIYAAPPDALDLSFEMYVPASASPAVDVAGFVFGPGDGGKETVVSISIEGGLASLFEEDRGGGNRKKVPGPLDLAVWRRYRLRVDALSKEARLTIEGQAADVVLPLALGHATPKEARIGIVYAGVQTLPFELWFDDVAIRR